MQRHNHIDHHRVRILPLLNKLQQFHHILAECETANVAQCMLVMQMTICVVLRMAGGEDVERNWLLDPISSIKSSNPFLLCHSAGIASRTRVLFVDCSTFTSPEYSAPSTRTVGRSSGSSTRRTTSSSSGGQKRKSSAWDCISSEHWDFPKRELLE